MSCVSDCMRWLLYTFNFFFAVCGLGILAVGIVVHLNLSDVTERLDINVMFPSISLMVVGSIIFVISFFGCCGAIRSSHCMIVTFASMLMLILLLQVAVAVYAFVIIKPVSSDDIERTYDELFQEYPNKPEVEEAVNIVQSGFQCCGVKSKWDFNAHGNFTGKIPWSCCGKKEGEVCEANESYDVGCAEQLKNAIQVAGTLLGAVAIGIAAVELIGIIFALCLANSIRNAERRGYRV
ncbi:tetraspanin 6 isoform X2 [Megachile rotundata]|uniref:tetraspanin 6 isoform X2 n=1 Tax=Megachile rotundata TaxID=143995 RepID=UPI000614D65D|nr:PREDICTED: CD63 antigen-like isoform X2 [Megachile rotundata]